ncbi:DUF423 domain-containing protein [Nisaea acidiphila]|uniref:DUF423 domain-containing protein n=1 Tax=Nisaea acidiphila TaxID=1862145 RepID=A0A9J7ASL3_9PROT|nr:DUF423 domain-containing protein [Nisaea acidiphila]UUX50263.1 DUF423 domain-containing protein [Nisaea acidiphila]
MIILTRFLWLALGVLGFVAVALGAYGAHAAGFDALARDRFETALLYQLVHLAGLAAALLLANQSKARLALASALLFIAGMLLFSGSLYANAFSGGQIPTGLAPLGGISFMAGWIALGIAGARTVRP